MLGAATAHADDQPRQPYLDHDGVFTGEAAWAPAAPEGCKTQLHVVVPFEVCKAQGIEEHVDTELLARWKSGPGALIRSPHTPYRGTPSQTAVVADACGLVCDRGDQKGHWNIRIERGAVAGVVGCSVGEHASIAVELGPAGRPVAEGIGVMWLTDLSHWGFVVDMPPDGKVGTKMLKGDNLCPAGQPSRDGGVVGALTPVAPTP